MAVCVWDGRYAHEPLRVCVMQCRTMGRRGGGPLRGAGGGHGDWATVWRWSGGVDGDPGSWARVDGGQQLHFLQRNRCITSYLLPHVSGLRSAQSTRPRIDRLDFGICS